MIRTLPVLLTAVTLALPAHAQDCPPGASTASTLPSGTAVRVIGLHAEDAYYDSSYSDTVGVNGTTTESLTNQGGCWFSGPVDGANGSSYYFYKAALAVTGGSAAPAPAGGSCPSGALTSEPTPGRTYTVLGLHPEDAYADGGTVPAGLQITFGEDTTLRDGCWISGPATSSSSEFYFFKVAVGSAGAGSPPAAGSAGLTSCPSNAHRGAIPAGSSITFLGVNTEDAYAGGSNGFAPGDTMTADAAMNQNGDCWYGGATSWSGGGSAYFYKAAFALDDDMSDKPVNGTDPVSAIAALSNEDRLDSDVKAILVGAYDRNGSQTIDTLNELNGIPCGTFMAIDRQYQAKWGVSVRAVLGFKSNLSWVGNSIGFTENLRAPGDRVMARCGIL